MPTVHIQSDGEVRLATIGNARKILKVDDIGEELRFATSVTMSGDIVVNAQSSPISWTDLDLSGIVGQNNALVILSIAARDTLDAVAIRTKGDVGEYYDTDSSGCSLGRHRANNSIMLMCLTDTNGVIQWRTENSEITTIRLIAYIV